jgi:tetratricopeptide (TPR) repeat protein
MIGPAVPPAIDLEAQLAAADNLVKIGKLTEAEALYAAVIKHAPRNLAAYFGAAECARQKKLWDACFAYLRLAAEAVPENMWPRLLMAADLRTCNRLDEAESAYRSILLVELNNVHAWVGLGNCARTRGDRHASLTFFLAGSLAAPSDILPLLEAAADLRELGQIEAAEREFQKVLVLAPGNVHPYLGLGHCARLRGDRQASLEHFKNALAAEPTNLWARLETAVDLKELGQIADAQVGFHRVLEIAPDNIFAHLGLGQCARAWGNRLASLAHFQDALAAEPGNMWAQLEAAADLRELGRFDEAQEGYLRVLTTAPQNIHAHLGLGHCARSRGDHAAALAAFERAHGFEPANAAILVEIAAEQRVLGQRVESDKTLARAHALDPRNVPAIIALAERALAASDVEQAYRIYQQASVEQPDQIWLRLGVVEALAALGKIDEAITEVAALAVEFGPLPDIHLKWLSILRQSGDYLEAARLGRSMVQQHPRHFWLRVELFQSENLVGSDADVVACLADAPAGSVREKAVLERLRGNFAESRWRTQEAIRHYEAAAALNPEDEWNWYDLVRATLLILDVDGARRHMKKFCQLTANVTKMRGRPLNVSQTHYGELINDYSIDAHLLQNLVVLQAMPPRERVHKLALLVRDNVDSTVAAACLMLALRQSGALSVPVRPVSDTAQTIPKNIVQFWDTPAPPEDVLRLMRSWREQNPGYTYQCFNDAMALEFLSARYPAPVKLAYLRARQPAQKADIFRLAWLAAEGGIYADADDRCLAPLGTIIPEGAELVLYQEDHATLCNNFIAVVPGHPLMARALRMAVDTINQGTGETVWFVTGPALLTRAFTQMLVEDGMEGTALPPGVVVRDRREMFLAVGMNCSPGYKKTSLHWSRSAYGEGAAEGADAET